MCYYCTKQQTILEICIDDLHQDQHIDDSIGLINRDSLVTCEFVMCGSLLMVDDASSQKLSTAPENIRKRVFCKE